MYHRRGQEMATHGETDSCGKLCWNQKLQYLMKPPAFCGKTVPESEKLQYLSCRLRAAV